MNAARTAPGQAVALAQAALAHIAAGGPERLLAHYHELFAEDFTFHPILAGTVENKTYVGREGFEEYWRDFTGAFGDPRFVDPRIEAVAGDRVLITSTLVARGAGSGVPIRRDVAQVFEARDARIASGRTFFSEADAREFIADA